VYIFFFIKLSALADIQGIEEIKNLPIFQLQEENGPENLLPGLVRANNISGKKLYSILFLLFFQQVPPIYQKNSAPFLWKNYLLM
jgi:hypothetical protein